MQHKPEYDWMHTNANEQTSFCIPYNCTLWNDTTHFKHLYFLKYSQLHTCPSYLKHLKGSSIFRLFNIFTWENTSVTLDWFSLIHLSHFLTNSSHLEGVKHQGVLYHASLSFSVSSFSPFAEQGTCAIDLSPKPVRLDQFAELYPIIKAGLRVRERERKREIVNEKEG